VIQWGKVDDSWREDIYRRSTIPRYYRLSLSLLESTFDRPFRVSL
jgi:hypothetical protein